MNKFLMLFLFVGTSIPLTAQIVTIPDANFKNALLNHDPVIDTNADNEIQMSEALAFSGSLEVPNNAIADLTGIEAFTEIFQLDIGFNALTSIDISSNVALINLIARDNLLTSVDVSQNVNLFLLQVSFNQISFLDVTNNPALSVVTAGQNPLNAIALLPNNGIDQLSLDYSNISEIDITQSPDLKVFTIRDNPLSFINFSENTKLIQLDIRDVPLQTIDISNSPDLNSIFMGANLFSSIDLSNNSKLCLIIAAGSDALRSVNVRNGNNTFFDPSIGCNGTGGTTLFQFANNANLEYMCVDSIAFAEEFFTDIPASVAFIEDCSLNITEFETLEILVYPNPVSDIFTVKADRSIDSVEVHNMLGQVVLSQKPLKTVEIIDISSLVAGSYFLRVVAEGDSRVFKIIKN